MKRLKLLFTLAIPVLLMQNAQAQTSSRLVAQANWYNNGAIFKPMDSTAYAYSGTRGGDLNHELKYNTATTWIATSDSTYDNSTNNYQLFDANNNVISNTHTYWNGTNWENDTKVLYFYGGDNQLDTMVNQTWGGTNWVNVDRHIYSYTLGNRLYSDVKQNWNSTTSSFDAATQTTYYYSVGGNLVQQIDQTYNTTTSTYAYTDKYDYTYTASNQLSSTSYSLWGGAGWIGNYMYTYAYDASGNRTSSLYQTYNTTTAAWDNIELKNYSSFTSMMPQMEIDQLWDTTGGGMWVNHLEKTYAYNAASQLTNTVEESWNVGGFWEHANGDRAANYYYQTYTTTGINNIVAAGEANLFPVPAQDMLNISLNWNEAQAFTVAIFDMNGAVVRQWSVPATAKYAASVPVNTLATGNYIVKITGTNSQIVKQIVVAH